MPIMRAEPFGTEQMRLVSAISQAGSFSRAGSVLGITQSAVSQQVRAIEGLLNRRLFNRVPSGPILTPDGEAYLVYAEAMLRVGEDARKHFEQTASAGPIRLGLTEDFARTVFPNVLGLFSREYPDFAFTVDCGLSRPLFLGLDEGRYDVVVAKRTPGRHSGERLWSEPLAWYGREGMELPIVDPIALVLLPSPSETRDAAIKALRVAGRNWRCMFQCMSYAMLEAAILAGIGIAGLGRNMHGPDLIELGNDAGLPPIGPVDIVMECATDDPTGAIHAFSKMTRETSIMSVSAKSSLVAV